MRWLWRWFQAWLDKEDAWMSNLKHYTYQEGCQGWEDAPQTKWDDGVRWGGNDESV
jgi:hypothetical protein